ncbi:MAG: flippase [Actinomycetota bacterium]|nr:flippase [Actinomycetota bacterium]
MAEAASAGDRAGRRALRNTGVRAAAEIVGKVATFLLFAVLAREVGQEGVGAFVFAFAFLGLGMVPIALGCDIYMLREVAKDRAAADRLFFNVIALKLAMAVPVLALCFAAVILIGYEGRTRDTVFVLAVGLLLDLLGKSLNGMFNATERGDLLARNLVVQRVSTAALGIGALAAGYGVVTVAALYSVGSAIGYSVAVASLKRHVGIPRRTIDPSGWRRLVATSFPFAIQDVFTAMLFRLDAVILSLIAAEAAVGRYGVAYRLLESTMFIGWALNGAFVAMFAYLGRDTDPTIGSVFQRSVKFALVVLVPVAVIMGVLAEPIVRIAFGSDFEEAAGAVRILAPVVIGLCLVTLCTSLIVTRRSPRTMIRVTAPMVAVNVALNLALIPSLEERGAALAMLVTEVLFVAVAIRIAADEVGGLRWASMVGAPVLAGAAMAVVMMLLAALPLAALAAGLLIYAVAFVALERAISPSDLSFAASTFSRLLPAGLASRLRP